MKVRVKTGGDPKEKKAPTSSELAEANRIAKEFSVRRNLIIGENAHVGNKIPQYVEAGTGKVLTPNDVTPPLGKLSSLVPSYVKSLEWDAKANLPYYIDEKTGDTQYVAKELFYSPRFKRTQAPQVPITSLLNGMAKR